MSSRARKLQSQKANVFNAVEGNPKLLDLLEIATSTAQKAHFIDLLLEILPTAFARFKSEKTSDQLFDVFTSWFGEYPNSDNLFSGISAAIEIRRRFFSDVRIKKRHFIGDIGLDWTADDKSSYFSKVNSVYNVGTSGKASFVS